MQSVQTEQMAMPNTSDEGSVKNHKTEVSNFQ